jgi:hypothetical protein
VTSLKQQQDQQVCWMTPQQQGALRRALLQRVADRLAYARALERGELEPGCWSCCWMQWEKPTRSGGRAEMFLYQLCGDDCAHWHHQTEVFLA